MTKNNIKVLAKFDIVRGKDIKHKTAWLKVGIATLIEREDGEQRLLMRLHMWDDEYIGFVKKADEQ